jgi:hypothetical protein
MEKGTVRVDHILRKVPHGVAATIEFVPRGICSEEEFDLAAVLEEAKAERQWVEKILAS